jgi:hypothetical protein
MAVNLALSVANTSDLPVSIVTDPAGAKLIGRSYEGVFDRVITTQAAESLSGGDLYIASKLEPIEKSPYSISIFLDSDMICVEDPRFLLDGIGEDDFRVFGVCHDSASCGAVSHLGIPIRSLIEAFDLDGYVYCSLAAFVFGPTRASHVARLMRSEKATWRARMAALGHATTDETLLGLLGKRTGVSFFNLPDRSYQRQSPEFRFTDRYSFIHPAPMRHAEALVLFYRIARARKTAGLPVGPSMVWFADILNRRSEQLGRSRRQAAIVRKIVSAVYP